MSESQNARFEPKLVASGNVRKYAARNEYMKAYQKRKYESNQEFRVGTKDRMNKRNFLKRLSLVLVKKLEAGPDIICLCGKRKNSKIKIYF
jgi:hypothetical protein